MRLLILATCLLLTLSACQGGGPRSSAIISGASEVISREDVGAYLLVDVDEEIAQMASRWVGVAENVAFIPESGFSPVVIGVGDTLDITIIATSDVGFIDLTNSTLSPLSLTTLPPQRVASDGTIAVPPVGRVSAKGQTVQQFESALTRRLSDVLVSPTAIVQMTDRESARVSILGQVSLPGTYSIDLNDMRLIELIARAGGPAASFEGATARAEALSVTVSRQGIVGRVQLDELYENPEYNIFLQPGDIVSVEPLGRKFTVLGAGGVNATLLLNEKSVTLADALGQAGGLLNRRADRDGVFLYRRMPVAAVQELGAPVSVGASSLYPTVFRFDFTKPDSLFIAGAFDVAEDDILYIADGPLEDIDAFFSVFTNFIPAPVEYVRDATIN